MGTPPRWGRPSRTTGGSSRHILRLADDEPYRREGKVQANLGEGRHDLAADLSREEGALERLRAQGYPVLDADAQRLSAFIRTHIGIDGHYAFHLPDFGGSHRPLRDPDTVEDG